MNKEEEQSYFDLKDLWNVFIWHLVPILAAAVLAVSVLYVYVHFVKVPKFKSTATVYILKQERESDYAYTQSDFSLALNVVNDCVYMLKSSEVLDDVIRELGLACSVSELSGSITTRNPDGTRILEVSVEADTGQRAKRIVDAVCRIGSDKISAAMGIDQVSVYSWGRVPSAPSNSVGLLRYALVGFAAALAVFFAYFIAYLVDDKVKTEEDVQKYLNLTVLGVIPNAGEVSGKKYKKYRRYRSYSSKYQRYQYSSGEDAGEKPAAKKNS